MKKKISILTLIILLFFITSCEYGLVITGIDIVKYPDRIVYIAGIDDSIDLSGGVVNIMTRAYPERRDPMDDPRWGNFRVTHSINFNEPGVYIITLATGGDDKYRISFPIQVIDKDYINDRLEIEPAD